MTQFLKAFGYLSLAAWSIPTGVLGDMTGHAQRKASFRSRCGTVAEPRAAAFHSGLASGAFGASLPRPT